MLDGQLEHRQSHRPPWPGVQDPSWTVEVCDGPERRRVDEALLTIGEGRFGTRGSLEEDGRGSEPMVLAGGVYDGSAVGSRLLEGPIWTALEIDGVASNDRRLLDLRSGIVIRERQGPSGALLRTVRFASIARPGVMVLWAEGPAAALRAGAPLQPPRGTPTSTRSGRGGEATVRVGSTGGGGITAVARQMAHRSGDLRIVQRIAGFTADPRDVPRPAEAARRLGAAADVGVAALLGEQRAAWAALWQGADVIVDGDPIVQLGIRFALHHLLSSVPVEGEAALGARGQTGSAYAGHVFWDADVFALPVLAAVRPAAARAMLAYRIARLPAARRIAEGRGLDGARFPWESALDGTEVTPPFADLPGGRRLPIHTRDHAEHIVADVAWGAWQYGEWTGDRAFLDGPGRPLIIDTAAYWASRVRRDGDGRCHIDDVVGPDEYHPRVDDNAYTNVMARWNLRRAAALEDRRAAGWRRIASALVDGYDHRSGRYEQFRGFSDLEPLLVSELLTTPVAADLVLGHERTADAQVVKQADVLMLHHLVPDEVAPGSLVPNLDHYLPRTAHGSSLSPAVHAALLARAGRSGEALDLLRLACRLDLDDLTGTTAGGLHTANLGGIWQAVVQGFAGVRPRGGVLHVDPHLPEAWDRLCVTVGFHSHRVTIEITHVETTVHTTGPVLIGWADGRRQIVTRTERQPTPSSRPGGGGVR
jgi:trehalose/maltose hydrolase-like predicted phosphorylase